MSVIVLSCLILCVFSAKTDHLFIVPKSLSLFKQVLMDHSHLVSRYTRDAAVLISMNLSSIGQTQKCFFVVLDYQNTYFILKNEAIKKFLSVLYSKQCSFNLNDTHFPSLCTFVMTFRWSSNMSLLERFLLAAMK